MTTFLVGLGSLDVLGNRAAPDVPWVSRVADRHREEVVAVLKDLEGHSEDIRFLSRRIMQTGRSYYAQFPAPLDLYALVRLATPDSVVESGVASGVSSAFMLMALKDNGRGTLHSIDFPVPRSSARGCESWAIPQGLSSGWAVPQTLKRGWDLRTGRSEALLKPLLDEVGRLGFYCHDSPVDVRHFAFEMRAITPHLGPGSVVVADNTDWETFEKTASGAGTVARRRKSSSLGAFSLPAR